MVLTAMIIRPIAGRQRLAGIYDVMDRCEMFGRGMRHRRPAPVPVAKPSRNAGVLAGRLCFSFRSIRTPIPLNALDKRHGNPVKQAPRVGFRLIEQYSSR
jgi:hypothetical protein